MNSQFLYENEENFYNPNEEEIKKELIRTINNVILELNVAHENYSNATGELVDYYSYQIKANQARYDYLLKLVKKLKIKNLKEW